LDSSGFGFRAERRTIAPAPRYPQEGVSAEFSALLLLGNQ